jgi:cytochrome c
MGLPRLLFVTAGLATTICRIAWAQSPTYGVGRNPTAEELRAWDISISPTGKELPAGQGTSKEGAAIYARKCAACHGANGFSGGRAPTLIKSDTDANSPCLRPCVNNGNLMAIHAPFATTIWDYIHRGMPLGQEGTLTANEVYSLVAFLLYRNGVIQEGDVMNAQTLPNVPMPNHDGFSTPGPWEHGKPRLVGYP